MASKHASELLCYWCNSRCEVYQLDIQETFHCAKKNKKPWKPIPPKEDHGLPEEDQMNNGLIVGNFLGQTKFSK